MFNGYPASGPVIGGYPAPMGGYPTDINIQSSFLPPIHQPAPGMDGNMMMQPAAGYPY